MIDFITQGRKNHIEIFERWFLITGVFSVIVRLDSRYFRFVISPLVINWLFLVIFISSFLHKCTSTCHLRHWWNDWTIRYNLIQCVNGKGTYIYTMPDINNIDAGFCNNLCVPAQNFFSKARFFWQVSLKHWCLFSFFFLEYDCADLIQVYSLFSTQFSQFWKAIYKMNQSLPVLHFYFLFSLKDNKGRVIQITTNTVMRDILLNK